MERPLIFRSCLLGPIVFVVACGPSVRKNVALPATHAPTIGHGVHLSLGLKVVNDPKAFGLDPPKAFQVTLENSLESEDGVFVNGFLSVEAGGADGVLHVQLSAGNKVLDNRCLVNAWSASAKDYFYLAPGSAIGRVVKLGCYHPPSTAELRATVTYEDRLPPASSQAGATEGDDPLRLPCQNAGGLAPEVLANVVRGPLVSNAVEFVLHGN